MSNQEETQSNDDHIAGGDLFMVCFKPNRSAMSQLPIGYHFRPCRKDELELWKTIHFNTPTDKANNLPMMTDYFNRVYAPKGDLFFEKSTFVCDSTYKPVGTAFIWMAYDTICTVHWVKVVPHLEIQRMSKYYRPNPSLVS